jgi:nucleoside-diphosphate-sugar epimerase
MARNILIAGSTGFIGSQITKKLAGLNPSWHLHAMTRKATLPPDLLKYVNISLVQADCLKPESYPDLSQVDCIVHSVGSITDLINYKELLKDPSTLFTNP